MLILEGPRCISFTYTLPHNSLVAWGRAKAHQYAVEHKHKPSLLKFNRCVKERAQSLQFNKYRNSPKIMKLPNLLTLARPDKLTAPLNKLLPSRTASSNPLPKST